MQLSSIDLQLLNELSPNNYRPQIIHINTVGFLGVTPIDLVGVTSNGLIEINPMIYPSFYSKMNPYITYS